jgi:DAK2 domain fusion protein YloV
VSDRDEALHLLRGAAAAIDRSRRRIDDLNVYPVPDGDTGTNLALTTRAVVEAIEGSDAADRNTLAREISRAALMGARGNSGVILSQIVRGAAEALAAETSVDGAAVARALRGAADAAYRAVRQPVEGTMLTVVRALAEAAERQAALAPAELLPELIRAGEAAVAKTPEQLDVLRDAGVVDAGGAGLVELLRGIAAAVSDEPLPEVTLAAVEEPSVEAIHQEPSRYRYCTTFVIEGELDPDAIEQRLEPLGDSLLVVGDERAVKAHVHTDDPGAALQIGTAAGSIANIEIADMHRQIEAREQRLLNAVPDPADRSAVVAVVTGDGNRTLFDSLGARGIVDGGRTMNPAAAQLVAAIDGVDTSEVVVLPNNDNVILAAEQAAELSSKEATVVPTTSLQAGLAAMVAFDPARSAAENAAEMAEALSRVATGAVTRSSRALQLNGRTLEPGVYLGLVDGEPVAGGDEFAAVVEGVVSRLLEQPRDVLTLLAGEEHPALDELVEALTRQNPEVEIEVHEGGQPVYPLLISAE